MKTTFDQTNGKTTWELDTWYQKVFYAVGIISSIYLRGAFMVGFFIGLMDI